MDAGLASVEKIALLVPEELSVVAGCGLVASAAVIQRARNFLRFGIDEPFVYEGLHYGRVDRVDEAGEAAIKRYLELFYQEVRSFVAEELRRKSVFVDFGRGELWLEASWGAVPSDRLLRTYLFRAFWRVFWEGDVECVAVLDIEDCSSELLSKIGLEEEEWLIEKLMHSWMNSDEAEELFRVFEEFLCWSNTRVKREALRRAGRYVEVCEVFKKPPDKDLEKYLGEEHPRSYLAVRCEKHLVVVGEIDEVEGEEIIRLYPPEDALNHLFVLANPYL